MSWTEREAIAGIALLAMYADGVIAGEEDDVLRDRLVAYPLFQDMDDDELGRVLQRLERRAHDAGADALLMECSFAIGARLRPTAYLVAAEVAVADGDVVPEEHAFLARLRKLLVLREETVAAIHQVADIRQRG